MLNVVILSVFMMSVFMLSIFMSWRRYIMLAPIALATLGKTT
jgi:hypothetical protein